MTMRWWFDLETEASRIHRKVIGEWSDRNPRPTRKRVALQVRPRSPSELQYFQTPLVQAELEYGRQRPWNHKDPSIPTDAAASLEHLPSQQLDG